MGALILLLLVTTRRIRSDQMAALVETQAPTPPVEPVFAPTPTPKPPAPAPPTRTPEFRVVTRPHVISKLPSVVSDDSEQTNPLRRDLAALMRRLEQLVDETAHAQEQKTRAQARLEALLSRQKSSLDSLQRLATEARDLRKRESDLQESVGDLKAQLVSVRRAIAQKEAADTRAVSRYRIVPFDGHSGTIRRPILIECTEHGFRFLPEGIEISREELADYTMGFNPLLSGASALNAFWAREDRGQQTGDPYILLIVRPGGAVGFYAAKRMLRRLKLPVGYELIDGGRQLDLPAVEPRAVEICRLAVRRTLARRNEIRRLRPIVRDLMGRPRNGGLTASADHRANADGDDNADDRVKAFRRLMAGTRTRNAVPDRIVTPSRLPVPVPPGLYGNHSENQPRGVPSNGADGVRTPDQFPDFGRLDEEPTNASPGAGRANVSDRAATPGVKTSQPKRSNRPGATRESHFSNPTRQSAKTHPRTANPSGAAGRAAGSSATPAKPGEPDRLSLPAAVTDGSVKPADNPQAMAGANGSGARRAGGNGTGPGGASPKIQFRRAVEVFVDPGRVTIGSAAPVLIDAASNGWINQTIGLYRRQIQAWGPPPKGMMWAPEMRLRVSPGANRSAWRLQSTVVRLGVLCTEEHTLTRHRPLPFTAGRRFIPGGAP